MQRLRCWPFVGLLAVALEVAPAGAGIVRDTWTASGSARSTGVMSRNYEQPLLWGAGNRADGYEELIFRVVAEGGSRLAWELHGVQLLALSTMPAGVTPAGASSPFGGIGSLPYRAVDTRWEWVEEEDVAATAFVDRVNARVAFERADLVVGRQAISLGKAYFWNPLDVFLAFGATQFDRDYKPGVDAVRLDVSLGDFSGVNLIGVPGLEDSAAPREGAWYRSAVLARGFGNLRTWDVAAQAGKILGGYQIGGAVAGEIAAGEIDALEVRGEAAYFLAQDATGPAPDDHLSAVFGLGYSFVEGDLQTQIEYLFNGAAEGPRSARFASIAAGRLQHVNRHLMGGLATYQLHPLVIGSIALVRGMEDGSSLLQPGLVYSAADEVEVLFGAVVARGSRPRVDEGGLDLRSEFGTYPSYYYVESKIYF